MVRTTPAADLLDRAGSDVARARRQLEVLGVAGIHPARVHLETAVVRLHPCIARDDVPREVRRAAERGRATLSSHLLAADDLEIAGVPDRAVAQLLRRATDAFDRAVITSESEAPIRG
jgi:hypothetical protein